MGLITKKKILQCQKLLHEDYHNVKIITYKSKPMFIVKNFLDGMTFKEMSDYLFKKSRAWYNPTDQKIHLPLFTFKGNKHEVYISLEVIYTLYHELRHHYQFTRKPRLVKRRDWNLLVTDSDYEADPTERDANKFAARMCIKYRDEISAILGIKSDWLVDGYE